VGRFPVIPAPLLYVARHGETDWNAEGRLQGHTDVPLNDRGRAQARALAAALAREGIGALVASDLARAKETADIVAGALGRPSPVIDPRLRERGFGVFEGRTKADLAETEPDAWRAWNEDVRARPPGGESHEDLVGRIVAAVEHAGRAHAQGGSPVLVVSHGAAIRALLLAATGLRVPPLGNGTVYRVTLDGGSLRDATLFWSGLADGG
jgi:broad specificity phosphatase PhoE